MIGETSMETKAENTKTLKWIIIAIIILAILAGIYFLLGPKGSAGDKSITVKVDHLNAKDTVFKISTDEEMLGDALDDEKLIEGSEGEFGMFVETVDGETADASKEEWWGYTVNGKTAESGVDSQPVEDGATYEFTLNVGYDSF